jgi:hypothetical protein
MKRVVMSVAAGASVFAATTACRADVRTLVENFPGGVFSPRFFHDIQPNLGGGPNWEVRSEIPGIPDPLPANFLHLYPARDTLGWDLTGLGSGVAAASVDVFDHNGGFANTSTARVIVVGENDTATLRPPNTFQIYTLSADGRTVGGEGLAIGTIQSITLVGAIDADFGNITLTVAHKHCVCDVNEDGLYSVQDIFDYLGLFFSGEARADINGDGENTVQDIFDMLSCWFGPAASGLPFCP